MEIITGTVVISKAGRDQKSLLLAVKCENGFVYVADGKERKLSAPKKKNPKHLQKTNYKIDFEKLTDKKLRIALREISKHNIAEESD